MERITEGQRAKRSCDGVIIVAVEFFYSVRVGTIVKVRLMGVAMECHAFNADTEETGEEPFHIDTTAPGVIFRQKAVEGAVELQIVGRFDVGMVVFRPAEGVSAPEADVQFMVAIE